MCIRDRYRERVNRYIMEHRSDTLAIHKLTQNIPLSRGDYTELEDVYKRQIVHCYNKIVILSPKSRDAKRLQLANIQEERMVTGAIKNKVDKIWTDIWAGGITNPLTLSLIHISAEP